jgi:amino acid adenylation domain-containing protein/non-ribosomal peptide synthase protein (TIGR01720 family)
MDTQKRPVEGFRLSPQQEHLWSLREIDHSEAYRARCVVLIDGELNVEILRRAVARVVAKHEILRTNFHRVAGMKGPVQVINDSSATQIFEHDLSGLEPQEQESGIRNLYQALGKQAFDLTSGPSLKVWLVKQSASRHALILSLPGLCADAATLSILVKDIGSAYETGGREGDADAEPIQYADLSEWLNKILEDPDPRPEYWRENDFSALPTLKLPSERTPFEQAVFGPQSLTMTINPQTAVGLEQMAQEYGVSTSVVLQTCWHALLWRLLKTPEIIVGTLYDGRNYEDMEQAPGLLARYLPIRSRPKEDTPFSELLEQIAESTEELYDYQEYFNWNQIGSTKREAHGTFFSLCFDFEQRSAAYCAGDTKLAVQEQYVCIDRFKVKLSCFKMKDFCVTEFSYDANLYQEEYIELLAGQFHKLLEGVIDDPEAPLSEVDLLSQWQRDQLLTGFNQTARERAAEATLPELFLRQVERTPEAIAVSYEGEQLSYEELNRRANQLAQWLRRRGVGVESVVGLLMERSVELVIGLLGVLKAGAAYLPLEPSYPGERLEYMVADAGVRVLLTQGEVRRRVGVEAEQVVCVDEQWAEIGEAGSEEVEAGLSGANLAYVIYTSGSTGRPKGVMITHHAICNHMLWMQEEFALGATDRVLQKTPFSFDASVWEFYAPLLSGARLVLARPGGQQESEYLVAVSAAEQITTLQVVPSMLQLFLEEPGVDRCKSLQRVFCGGEVLSVELAERFYERLRGARLYNLYGPTEAAIDVSYWACEPGSGRRSVPIGRPIANLRLYILDEGGEPAALGVAGELHIGGVGLARGYWQRAELTAEKFIPDGVSGRAGERLYRTGDVARYQVGGEIEYVGRQDEQVKLRGYRIELGEVEAVVRQHEGVQAAVVVVQEGGGSGSRRLVCYVVWRGAGVGEGGAERGRKLQEYLRERLPAYMVPAVVLELAELPLQPNGKVDRKRLPEVAAVVGAGVQVGPRNEVEEALCRIWAEVLGVERVGIHNNFFELGGDSILGIQIVARANQAGLRLTAKHLFQYQTVAELATVAGTTLPVDAEQRIVTGSAPLTPIQHYFFETHPLAPHHYNQSVMLKVPSDLDLSQWRQIVYHLLAQHDALRLRFRHAESGWQQINAGIDYEIPFVVADLSMVENEEQTQAIADLATQAQASLCLSDGLLLRVVLFILGRGRRPRLLIIAHHLIVDGVSWRILLEDLQRCYEQLSRDERIKLPPKTTSFKEWARRLSEHAQSAAVRQSLDYWIELLSAPISRVPLDYEGGQNTVASAEVVRLKLSEGETRSLLQDVPSAYRTQINDVLLTALMEAYAEWSGERRLLLDVEGHGREEVMAGVDVTRTVGWFTAYYPVCLAVKEGAIGLENLKSIKEQLRASSRYGMSYALLRYLCADKITDQSMRALPPAEVVFNYLGQFDQTLIEKSKFAPAIEDQGESHSQQEMRHCLFEINSKVAAGQFELSWSFSPNLHRRATIEFLAESYLAALRRLIAGCRGATAVAYTPSDFPLAQLNQQQLDELLCGERGIEDVYPLSPLQQGLLFHNVYEPESGVYVVQQSYTLHEEIDALALERAWQLTIDRHPSLRAAFYWQDLEEPLQIVRGHVGKLWEQHDWRMLTPAEQQERLEAFLKADRARGFDLTKAPLMRLVLIQLSEDAWQFIWSSHQILLDGWSVMLVLKEVTILYESLREGRNLELNERKPYRDYIRWLQQQDLAAAERFWRQTLRGLTAPTNPGFEREWNDASDSEGTGRQLVRLSRDRTTALQSMTRQHQLTLNTLLQGAWALLLHSHGGEDDVVFGATTSGRPPDLAGVEFIVGLFINTLPVRVRIAHRMSLLAWLKELQRQQAEARQYEFSPLTQVHGWSEVPRSLPLFESLLVFENYPEQESLRHSTMGLKLSGMNIIEQTNYPLLLVANPGEQLSLSVVYERRRFETGTINRILRQLEILLDAMVTQPESRLRDLLPLLQDQVAEVTSSTVRAYEDDRFVF